MVINENVRKMRLKIMINGNSIIVWPYVILVSEKDILLAHLDKICKKGLCEINIDAEIIEIVLVIVKDPYSLFNLMEQKF